MDSLRRRANARNVGFRIFYGGHFTLSTLWLIVYFTVQGNGGAKGTSYKVILFNLLRPKNDLNEIYHCNIKGSSVGEIMISQAKFY